MSPLRSGLQAFALFLLATSFAHGATVYKWTDDKGVVQYTDSPPEGRTFEKLAVSEAGSRSRSEAAAEAAASEEAAGTANKAQLRIQAMVASCQDARKNLEVLEQYTRVSMDKDGDGTEEVLEEAERIEAIAANRELVERNCVEPAPPTE